MGERRAYPYEKAGPVRDHLCERRRHRNSLLRGAASTCILRAHARTQARTEARTEARTHTYTYTHTHTHTRTQEHVRAHVEKNTDLPLSLVLTLPLAFSSPLSVALSPPSLFRPSPSLPLSRSQPGNPDRS